MPSIVFSGSERNRRGKEEGDQAFFKTSTGFQRTASEQHELSSYWGVSLEIPSLAQRAVVQRGSSRDVDPPGRRTVNRQTIDQLLVRKEAERERNNKNAPFRNAGGRSWVF
jgi:hypothetical protein